MKLFYIFLPLIFLPDLFLYFSVFNLPVFSRFVLLHRIIPRAQSLVPELMRPPGEAMLFPPFVHSGSRLATWLAAWMIGRGRACAPGESARGAWEPKA
ncbi:MAG: hypothetical protein C5B50_30320 [Verrucomicrobia bacterium]|nr:MAG: hypothetical protein C5B50_30320 [Verrucomicrobiota bacterium]